MNPQVIQGAGRPDIVARHLFFEIMVILTESDAVSARIRLFDRSGRSRCLRNHVLDDLDRDCRIPISLSDPPERVCRIDNHRRDHLERDCQIPIARFDPPERVCRIPIDLSDPPERVCRADNHKLVRLRRDDEASTRGPWLNPRP